MFELLEAREDGKQPSNTPSMDPPPEVSFEELMRMRTWGAPRLRRLLVQAVRDEVVERLNPDRFRLTEEGAAIAANAVRNHRLWELFLIHHAAFSPARVDRAADEIEHVLGAPMVAELEELLEQSDQQQIPASPHGISVLATVDASSGSASAKR